MSDVVMYLSRKICKITICFAHKVKLKGLMNNKHEPALTWFFFYQMVLGCMKWNVVTCPLNVFYASYTMM